MIPAIALTLIAPAAADSRCVKSGSPMCSVTFYGEGVCDGTDQLVFLKRDGAEAVQLVRPWESKRINIVGTEVTFIRPPASLSYAYVGNAAAPNQMMFMGPGQSHSRVFYPPGLGFHFPGDERTGHVDLHVSCPASDGTDAIYRVFVTFYYTMVLGLTR